jgi:hypothetical protein
MSRSRRQAIERGAGGAPLRTPAESLPPRSIPAFRVARSAPMHRYVLVAFLGSWASLPPSRSGRTRARCARWSLLHAARPGPDVEPAGRLRRSHLRGQQPTWCERLGLWLFGDILTSAVHLVALAACSRRPSPCRWDRCF